MTAFRTGLTLAEHYQRAKTEARAVKLFMVGGNGAGGWRSELAAGDRSAHEFISVLQMLKSALAVLENAAAQPDIDQLARGEEQDPNYDVAAAYIAMRDAMVAILDWIFTNFPKHNQAGADWWLVATYASDGTQTVRRFTPAQTEPLRTLIDAYAATVN